MAFGISFTLLFPHDLSLVDLEKTGSCPKQRKYVRGISDPVALVSSVPNDSTFYL
jgi:hypothetical protein